jgi:excisionase family DNA binding protein
MREPLSMDDGLWDANDVAAYLKVSRSWVYQKVAAGLVPYVRVGGLVRFVPECIKQFALSSSRMPGEQAIGRR